jgi:hypothetical protein
MARISLLIVLSFIGLPAAAQPTARASPTSERHCYSGPVVRATPESGLILDDSNLFQRQADGTCRMRSIFPLFRPSRHEGQR